MRMIRRNQKIMLVVFGVLLMISFLFAGIIGQFGPAPGRNGAAQDVVRLQGHTLNISDLDRLRGQHVQAASFLQALADNAMRTGGQNFQPKAPMINVIPTDGSLAPSEINRELVLRQAQLRKGRELGIVVSDEAVLDYIRRLVDDPTLTTAQLDRIARDHSHGRWVYANYERILKDELLIMHMERFSQAGLSAIPNLAQAWDIYRKFHERIECDVMRLAVADFYEQITDQPTRAELRRLYDEGAHHFPDLRHERPGFKMPRKMAFGYLSAHFDDFLEREMAAITPEQIEEEYQRLVERNDPSVFRAPAFPQPIMPQGDRSWFDDPDMPLPPPGDRDDADPNRDDDAPQWPGDRADEQGRQDSPQPDQSELPPAPPQQQDDPNEPQLSQISAVALHRWVLESVVWNVSPYASLAATPSNLISSIVPLPQSQEQPPNEQTPDRPPADRPDDGQQRPDAVPPPPPSDPPATEPDADRPAPGDDQDPDTAPQWPDAAQEPRRGLLDDLGDDQDLGQPRPLSEVADTIRRNLASEPALQAMYNALESASRKINEYRIDLAAWRHSQNLPASERDPEPQPINPQAIADDFGLRYGEIELVDERQFQNHPVGQLTVAIDDINRMTRQQFRRPVPIWQLMFGRFEMLDVFQAQIVEEYFFRNVHIIWATEKREPQVVTFEEAVPQIEQYWRHRRALELAQNRARELAEQVSGQTGRLRELHADSVQSTGEFSWYNPMTFQFGPIGGVQNPGETLVRTAFNLEVGQAAHAPNADRTAVYVLQKTSQADVNHEQMKDEFFQSLAVAQGMPRNIHEVHFRRMMEIVQDWRDQLERNYQIQWLTQ